MYNTIIDEARYVCHYDGHYENWDDLVGSVISEYFDGFGMESFRESVNEFIDAVSEDLEEQPKRAIVLLFGMKSYLEEREDYLRFNMDIEPDMPLKDDYISDGEFDEDGFEHDMIEYDELLERYEEQKSYADMVHRCFENVEHYISTIDLDSIPKDSEDDEWEDEEQ